MQAIKFNTLFLSAVLAFFFLASFQQLYAQSSTDIRVVKIAAADQTAVVKLAGRQLQLVRPGDVLEGWGLVKEIAAGRLVIEKTGASGTELIVIRLRNGEQTIERIGRDARQDEGQMTPQSPGSGNTQGQSN